MLKNMFQDLTLERDSETGKISYKRKDSETKINKTTATLIKIIEDTRVKVNINSMQFEENKLGGEFWGNKNKGESIETDQRIDPYKLEKIDIAAGETIGKNLMHEITESYEGGIIAINNNLNGILHALKIPQKRIEKEKNPAVRKSIQKLQKLHNKHNRYYQKAHRKAFPQTPIYYDDDNKKYVFNKRGQKVYF